jgi:hypothetical protein
VNQTLHAQLSIKCGGMSNIDIHDTTNDDVYPVIRPWSAVHVIFIMVQLLTRVKMM